MQILLSYEGYSQGKFKKKVKNLDVKYDNMKEKYQHKAAFRNPENVTVEEDLR